MTKREFLDYVRTHADNAEVAEFATAEIERLDNRNHTRQAKATAKRATENEPIVSAIVELMGDGKQRMASEIATKVSVSTAKASALCRQLVDAGTFKVADVKIKGKGSVKGYTLVSE